jgi:hypothetical protein
VRRSELKPGKPLERKSELERKAAPKRKQPKRNWEDARAKVEREEYCRLARTQECAGPLEAAHVIGRDRDAFATDGGLHPLPSTTVSWWVAPVRVVPLCRRHHKLYDDHAIDILGALSLSEQLQAVVDSDGIENARVRLAPGAYREGQS